MIIEEEKSNTRLLTTNRAIKIFSFLSGASILVLYLEPSKDCATNECGKWVSRFLNSEKAAGLVFFTFGGLSVSAVQGYFTLCGVEGLRKDFAAYPNLKTKLLHGIKILLLGVITQGIQPVLVAVGVDSPIWATVITGLSTIPATAFMAVSLLKIDFPYWWDRLLINFGQRNKGFHDELSRILVEKWHLLICENITEIQFSGKDPLVWLLEKNTASIERETCSRRFARYGMQALGFSIVSLINVVFGMSAHKILVNKVGFDDVSAGFFTGFLLLGSAYNYFKVTIEKMTGIYYELKNLWRQKSIGWLSLKLYPKLMIGLTALNTITAIFSYAVIGQLLEIAWPDEFSKPAFRTIVEISFMCSSFIFLSHFQKEIMRDSSLRTIKDNHKNLFLLEKEVSNFQSMTSLKARETQVYNQFAALQVSSENSSEDISVGNYSRWFCCRRKDGEARPLVPASRRSICLVM